LTPLQVIHIEKNHGKRRAETGGPGQFDRKGFLEMAPVKTGRGVVLNDQVLHLLDPPPVVDGRPGLQQEPVQRLPSRGILAHSRQEENRGHPGSSPHHRKKTRAGRNLLFAPDVEIDLRGPEPSHQGLRRIRIRQILAQDIAHRPVPGIIVGEGGQLPGQQFRVFPREEQVPHRRPGALNREREDHPHLIEKIQVPVNQQQVAGDFRL